MEIKTSLSASQWNDFIRSCSDATIYHTYGWKSVLEDTFGYIPKYLFPIGDNGQVAGELPLFYVKSRLFGSHLSSLPFSHDCGYIGDTCSRNDVLEKAIRLSDSTRSSYLEVRSDVQDSRFREMDAFYTHVLELSDGIEKVWGRLDRGSVRWAIKKSREKGAVVSSSQNIEDLREFYELNCMTKKDLGVPCHPWKFFKNLFHHLGEYVSLYTVRCDSSIVAGGIMVYFKDTVLYGYGAADPAYLNIHPYHAFLWSGIQDACSRGYSRFDFGRSSDHESGLRNFKKRWGTREIKLKYSYYPKTASSALADAYGKQNLLYSIASFTIRYSPMATYKIFSDVVSPEIG